MSFKSILAAVFFLLLSTVLFSQNLTFDSPQIFDAGYNSNMLISADFNNDGLIDIATANYGGDNISILLGVTRDSFASEVLYSAGNGTFDIATADFNRDSVLDLVVSNILDDNISVLMGIGDGTFSSKVNYAAFNNPKGIVVGKFNADSIIDIAVANEQYSGRVSVFIGKADGTFYSKVDYMTGDKPNDLLVDYIDQDSILDLITVDRNDDKISVLRGNGNGTFKSAVTFDVGHFPEYATLGYFNSDSLIDIAVCNSWNYDSVSILLGDTGTMFKPMQNYYCGYRPFAVTAADFNLDSKIDLAVTIVNYDSVNILYGNGDGSFQMPIGIVSGDGPHGIISLDIEGDSDIDLLNVNYYGGGSTNLYLNTLCPAVVFAKNKTSIIGGNDGSATALVTGGLRPYTYLWDDSNAQTDSVANNLSAGTYTLVVNDSLGCVVTTTVIISDPTCSLSLETSRSFVSAIGGNDGQIIVSPINGTYPYSYSWNHASALNDSIASSLVKGSYQVIVTDSVGCKDTAEVNILEIPCLDDNRTYTKLGANDIEVCFINSDSIPDLVTLLSVAYSTDKVHISFGNGDGTFTYHSSFTVGTGGDQPVNLEVNDFNGDNINDIIVAVPDGVNGFSVYLGNGDSTFQTKTDYYTGSRPWDMVSHDFDYDGDVDLMICRDQGGDVRLMKNNGSGVFSYYSRVNLGSSTYPKHIKAGYLNNDTLIDIVVTTNTGIAVALGHATYTFLSPTKYTAGLGIKEVTLGDFNNDSIIDIAASGSSYDEVYVFIGKGDGTFNSKVEYPSGDYPCGIEAYDMNGDGNIDLAVSNASDSTLFIMLGDGSGAFDSTMMYHIGAKPFTSVVSDIDADGDKDLLITLSGADSVAIIQNCFIDKCMFISVDSIQKANRNTYDGLVSVTVNGANPPFTYQWNDSLQQTTSIADSLIAGTYKLIVTDSLACSDSIFVVVEEIPCDIDTHFVSITICEDDSVYFAGAFRTQSGFYYDSLINILGCDSVRILDLTIIDKTYSSLSISQCYSYTISGSAKTYNSSGVYTDTIQNVLGCDSIITLYLTIHNSTSSVVYQTSCTNYSVPSGDETYTSSGIYADTIPNYNGCDSLLTINLTVNYQSSSTISETVCNSYIVPSGDETYTSSGVYADTIPNYAGCDSLLTINLIVNHQSSASISETVCNSYIVPSGEETYTISGVYADTIPNYAGCDSLLTIYLTVNYQSSSTISETVCNSYIVPSGEETYTISGVYADTIPNYAGCDSLLTIYLTVNYQSSSTISETVCNSYLVPSGDETYTSSGVYADTIPNYTGCDSLLTIILTVNYESSSTITETVCNSYIVPSGDETYTISGVYADTIPNYAGCDSLLRIYLTVNYQSSSTISETVCNSYIVPSGDETYTISGVYSDTISNYVGCDSLLTINLTVNHQTSSTILEKVCDSYIVPSGDETYFTSGIYFDTILNYNGCDSLITINLTVVDIDMSVIQLGDTLKASTVSLKYQWLDCDAAYQVIVNETNQFFIADKTGNYAVEIQKENCLDTSNCYYIEISSIKENSFAEKLNVFPNPTSGSLKVDLGKVHENIFVHITDEMGQTITSSSHSNTSEIDLIIRAKAGTYYIIISNGVGQRAVLQIVKL
ncbi:MAG: T9SS type A sorting domain-containing protein [Bacteroidetes bacterium]|nr:T9SS type A sorting domain-containing protein [Bacteroidota bacterium]